MWGTGRNRGKPGYWTVVSNRFLDDGLPNRLLDGFFLFFFFFLKRPFGKDWPTGFSRPNRTKLLNRNQGMFAKYSTFVCGSEGDDK